MCSWGNRKVEVLSCLGKGEVREFEWLRGREVSREKQVLRFLGKGETRKKNQRSEKKKKSS